MTRFSASARRLPSKPRPSPRRQTGSIDEKTLDGLVAERARFHRFVTARIGDAALAEDILQDSLVRALSRNDELRRRESAVAWFYRILRNAITDQCRKMGAENRRKEKYLADLEARAEDAAVPPGDETAVCACFRGLLPSLKPRHAEVIRRVDLEGEPKPEVAARLGIAPGALDVLLHRARQALRRRLEIFCGACSRESCLACWCQGSG